MYSFITLTPQDERTYSLYLTLAYRWILDRRHLFPHTGGQLSLTQYLERGTNWELKQIGVFVKRAMVSLFTVEAMDNNAFFLHITSPRKTDAALITTAIRDLGCRLFANLDASAISADVPVFNGHVGRGSERIVEACGLLWTGTESEEVINGLHYGWRKYELTRDRWERIYGRKDNHEHDR